MKKQKRRQAASAAAEQIPEHRTPAYPWWPWAAGLAAVICAFVVYGPALSGAFVFDDRLLPFMRPEVATMPLSFWFGTIRPLLMFSFWMDYSRSGTDPGSYHVTNLVLHLLNSGLMALIAARLLQWVGVDGVKRSILAGFAGGLFLLHPIQTESVAYVASRSEALSILLFYAAFAVFLYRDENAITIPRTIAILTLFGAAAVTKEHTVVLPALILLADYFWGRGGIRKNGILYGALSVAGAVGGFFVWKVLSESGTAGFRVAGLTPLTYFFTQCRVIWNYARLFVFPYGQNLDPDIPISHTPIEHGAIGGLLALLGLVAAAWVYRKRFPLAAFGAVAYLLLLAPTSSFVPILDVQAEHRVYLPFLGLTLICLEFLRHVRAQQAIGICAAVLAMCAVLTYQRNQAWASPVTLWQDTAAKSPKKLRPRFQLAFAYFEAGRCAEAVPEYEAASKIGPATYELLADWATSLDCAGRPGDAVPVMKQALQLENTAHAHAVLGSLYAKTGQHDDALAELKIAESIDPQFEMTYVYRGIVDEMAGDRASAAQEYQRALQINPSNQAARDALARATR